MRVPTAKLSTETLLGLGKWHLAAMGAVDATKGMVEGFQPVQDELAAAGQALTASLDALLRPQIELTLREIETEKTIRRISSTCVVIDGVKNGPTSKALFPRGLNPVIQPVSQRQVDEGQVLLKRAEDRRLLIQEQLAGLFEQLRTDLNRMVDVLGQRKAGHAALATARADEQIAREDFCRAYSRDMGPIWELYPDDRRMREFFFQSWGSSGKTEDGGEDGGEEVAPTGKGSGKGSATG